ncbi:MAG: MFS transporter [Burkholderiaceae bacterium]
MKNIFYGWRMVGAASGIQFLQAGLLYQAFGAYVAILTEERGWSKTALSGGSAVQAMEAAVLGPLLGWIIDRFGPKWMIRAGVLLMGAGFMILSQLDSLMGFYGAIIVIAFGSSLCGFFPLNVAVINWFDRQRGKALSGVAMGLALGGVAVPAVAWAMVEFGWRNTAFGSGLLIMLVGFPLATVFRSRPEDFGEVPDGKEFVARAEKDETMGPRRLSPGFTATEAMRTSAFWLLAFGHGFALFVVTAVNTHAISHMKEGLGYTVTQASLVITIMTLFQIAGVALGWFIGDRFPKRFIAAGCMVGHCLGMLLLTYASNPVMLVLFAVVHGTAWGLRGPFMQALRADYFGREAIGKIMGFSSLIIVIGQVGGPVIAGYLTDVTGNYELGFTVLALAAGAGTLMFLNARPPAPPVRPAAAA